MWSRVALVAAVVVTGGFATAQEALGWDLASESKNYSKTLERQALYQSPAGQLLLRDVSNRNMSEALAAQLNDPEREFVSDLCWSGGDGCAGDARLYDWGRRGYGIVKPVLFTARNGATIAGHVWATRAGPAKRPGVVITNGSVQADEQMYWFAAQTLAKAGYVVLTFDPQGQGQSDTFGEGADQSEGFPAQSDGRPFFDGTVDALDFFLSSAGHPYVPRPSCSTGTSHQAKQARRVKAGLDAAYNPFASMLDPTRIGLAGHSYGAAGVSYVAQSDPRVDAVVAWDNLAMPVATGKGFPPGEADCPARPQERANAAITKPALGMSADYGLPPTPNTSAPTDDNCGSTLGCKSKVSREFSKAGVDTGELLIRGGSHLDFSFISNPAFGATLRGADLIAWYTQAWFDKYVKHDLSADRRLLTDRWRYDSEEAAVDPDHDGNMFSSYFGSRLDIHRADGTRFTCEDLRSGCTGGLVADDGYPGVFSYFALATTPDGKGAAPGGDGIYASSPVVTTCTAKRRFVVTLTNPRGARIMRIVARVGRRIVGRSRGRRVGIRLSSVPAGVVRVRLTVTLQRNGKTVRTTVTRRYAPCAHRG
jgi:dienelactone hydrolase